MRLRGFAVGGVLPAVLCVLLFGLDREATQRWPSQHAPQREVRMPSAIASMLSFGMQPLVADYLWIDAVQYFAHTLGHHTHEIVNGKVVEKGAVGVDMSMSSAVFYRLVRRVVEVDPYFVRPALLGALFLMDPHADPLAGLSLLEHGVWRRPDSWQLRLWHGFYTHILLRDTETAVAELDAAQECRGCPDYVQGVRNFVQTAPDSLLARFFFSTMYEEAQTPAEREYFRKRLEELDAGIDAFDYGTHHHLDPHAHQNHSHDLLPPR